MFRLVWCEALTFAGLCNLEIKINGFTWNNTTIESFWLMPKYRIFLSLGKYIVNNSITL